MPSHLTKVEQRRAGKNLSIDMVLEDRRNLAIGANHASQTRIDAVASSQYRVPTLTVFYGTPGAGPPLVPQGYTARAYVTVAPHASEIVDSDIERL